MAYYDGESHHYDADPAALDAYPAGEGNDLLLVGPDNGVEWIQTDRPVDLTEWQ